MTITNESKIQSLIPRSPKHQNLTKPQKLALAELTQMHNIVIKPADKGSSVVIQNRVDYVSEGVRQLNDKNFYEKQSSDLSPSHWNTITSFLKQLRETGQISEKCHNYLTDFKFRTAKFYLLPKIHKGKLPPPGRPIISGNNSPTERISQLVYFFLKDIAPKGKSFIKDTSHFLHIIHTASNLTNKDTILVTLDVCSLYTNIPNSEGLKATNKALIAHRPGGSEPYNHSILRLLQMVLTMNNFEFDGQHYLQVGGTAMGTRAAPNYAIICVNEFEETHVYTYRLQPLLWVRYIDDIFMLWQHGSTELTSFIEHLNTCHPTFKFTCDQSPQR